MGTPPYRRKTRTPPIKPRNPYGISKAFAHEAVSAYRDRGLHASSLILYNHESPRRPTGFVTRKITSTVAAISRGKESQLVLGNLDARRDWGWAPDYVRAMYLAATHVDPLDFVVASGQSHSVEDFVRVAFNYVGIENWSDYVSVDQAFVRPNDVRESRGDSSRACRVLGWQPSKTFEEIVAAMMDADLALLDSGAQ